MPVLVHGQGSHGVNLSANHPPPPAPGVNMGTFLPARLNGGDRKREGWSLSNIYIKKQSQTFDYTDTECFTKF